MKIETVIVDDELPICDEIEYLLKKHIDIEVVARFDQPFAALDYIQRKSPRLVFLDISMPGLSGLEVAERLGVLRQPPLIVFLTAFPEHALEAFKTPAVGYVTKPITEDKLSGVLGKIRRLAVPVETPKLQVNKICVFFNGKIIPIEKDEIALVYVKDKDVFVRTKEREYSTVLSMQELEKILIEDAPGSTNFLRVHRQYLVNLDKVLEIIPWFKGAYSLKLDDCNLQQVPVSRNKIKEIKAIMGLK
jgi:DNA-binding LytR/AlgR family response regulator